jgi:hypothetical protein
VIQRSGGAGLTLESLDSLRISRPIWSEQLDRDRATERRVLGSINQAHPAFAELCENPVVRNGRANHREALSLRCGTYGRL